jgi:hypothetical protein
LVSVRCEHFSHNCPGLNAHVKVAPLSSLASYSALPLSQLLNQFISIPSTR